jgi:hypothetical protein
LAVAVLAAAGIAWLLVPGGAPVPPLAAGPSDAKPGPAPGPEPARLVPAPRPPPAEPEDPLDEDEDAPAPPDRGPLVVVPAPRPYAPLAPPAEPPPPRAPDPYEEAWKRWKAAGEAERGRIATSLAATPSDLAHDLAAGRRWLEWARSAKGPGALEAYDRARRLLSRGLLLPEAASVPWRRDLEAAIAEANAVVYGGGVALTGATEVIEVKKGDYPWKLVEGKGVGWRALLAWNSPTNQDPKRMPAGARWLFPIETAWLLADLEQRTVQLWIGETWIREWPVVPAEGPAAPVAGVYALGGPLGPDHPYWTEVAWMKGWTQGEKPERSVSLFGTEDPVARSRVAGNPWLLMERADSVDLYAWLHQLHPPQRWIVVR